MSVTARPVAALLLLTAWLAVSCGSSPRPGPAAPLRGSVLDGAGRGIAGAMVTAADGAAGRSVSVFSDGAGRYELPALPVGVYRLRARLAGFDGPDGVEVDVSLAGAPRTDLVLRPTTDLGAQLPASYFYALLDWPSAKVKGDFTRACANCHPIGFGEFREPRSDEQWRAIVDRMISYGGVPFFAETRPLLLPTLLRAFGESAPRPRFAPPPAPTGDATRAVITEWEIDPVDRPGCHDLELDGRGVVYMVPGLYLLDPATGERRHLPIEGGGHSVERGPDGSMWITAPGPETLIRYDVATGETDSHPHPRIGDDLGSYPHTLRFDDRGILWETLTRSNHVARFDPATAEFRYFRLPPADPEDSGVPIPVAYGLDIAPDQTVWWSQLFAHRIGMVDPGTGAVRSWRTPFDGPRRLFVGPDGIVWVPAYGTSELGRFDPATESWRRYPLPTLPHGSDLPYAVAVNRRTGDVWITGANSDTLIRFRPSTEQWTVFPLPTPVDFTREIEFDDDGNVWTCTSNAEIGDGRPGTGRLIRLQLLARDGRCGDGEIQLGEECDDGNAAACDGCSDTCRIETGCGDGVACGGEGCDDGNTEPCDGCSPTCAPETGWSCGDGELRRECAEDCEPAGVADPGCTPWCRRVPVCGDGTVDAGEACDDGNTLGCDGCPANCRAMPGCADGDRCGAEECDDGNLLDCDGCSASCTVEPGAACGDGEVLATCGEQCDPPDTARGCSPSCRAGDGSLGARHFSFGGGLYSSSLGAGVELGRLAGAIDIEAGIPGADGRAGLVVPGPVVFSAAILGGTYGTYCVRLDGCRGFIDCDGGSAVGVSTVQDSAGAGVQGNPPVIALGLGNAAPAGAAILDCAQSYVQLPPGHPAACAGSAYPPATRVVYTTGHAEGLFTAANPKVGTAALAVDGEPFSCASWNREDGPGALVGTFLVEEERQAGDIVNANLLDD